MNFTDKQCTVEAKSFWTPGICGFSSTSSLSVTLILLIYEEKYAVDMRKMVFLLKGLEVLIE